MSGITLNKLEAAMETRGIIPEALVLKTGLSLSTILKARKGGTVTLGTATLIAQGLKMKMADLK